MKKYRKKPLIIEAIQWDGTTLEGIYPIPFFKEYEVNWHFQNQGILVIETLEGEMQCLPGNYIIKGIKDEMYACDSDIFEATYDLVED